MKKNYKIEVDCANCANKVEAAVAKIDGVLAASVNFMALKMKVELADGTDEAAIVKQIRKSGKKIDDDFEIFA